jgi:aspartate/methionine/tyrosine aminotransferase
MTAAIDPFHAIAISRRAYQLQEQGARVIHMEFGQPSTGAPAAAIARAHQVLDSDAMGYWENEALKARIACDYQERYGVAVDPARIFLTAGASPALVLALHMLFRPGARIAMARPGYVAYRNTVRALHMEPVEIACGAEVRFQLSADALAAIEPAPDGVIIASPANPTGTIIPPDEMERIAQVCIARGIRIISDEIYHGLVYAGQASCALQFERQATIINSFSKYYSMAGWRLGWLVAPPEEVERARALLGNLFLMPPSLAQHAALVAFDCKDELEANVATYRRNRDLLLDALPGLGLGRIAPPDGAFYIYADISHLTNDSMAFCLDLLEATGVATAPGRDFDPVEGNRHMRFSFAVSTAETEDAIARLGEWLATRAGTS